MGRFLHTLALHRTPTKPVGVLSSTLATPEDLRAMVHAIALASRAAKAGEVPVAAVVYETNTGHEVARAQNQREQSHDPTAHAEILALARAAAAMGSWRLDTCTLVVTLEPCAMCAGAIVNARVGRVVYGAADPKAGFAGSLGNLLCDPRLNHRVSPIAGVHADACAALLRDFFASRRAASRARGTQSSRWTQGGV